MMKELCIAHALAFDGLRDSSGGRWPPNNSLMLTLLAGE
jgi:hypothetical protein